MLKVTRETVFDYGIDLSWFLRLLCQLPPIEIEIPGSVEGETFVIVVDLKLKS